MAGYYAEARRRREGRAALKDTGGPRLAYRMTMGVRAADQEWKRQLNRMIRRTRPEINRIILSYGVPLLDEQDRPITGAADEVIAMTWARAPGGRRDCSCSRRAAPQGAAKLRPSPRAIAPRTIARRCRTPCAARASSPRPRRRQSGKAAHGDLRRRDAAPAAPQPAARHDLARQAARDHPGRGLAAGHRLRRARAADGGVAATRASRASPAATATSSRRVLPARLLDVVERREARPGAGL